MSPRATMTDLTVIAIPLGVAGTPLVFGGGATVATTGAVGLGPAVAWASQHAANAARALDVTLEEASGVIARGTPYWDMAYRNLAVFASRGSGTVQIAIKEIQQDGTF